MPIILPCLAGDEKNDIHLIAMCPSGTFSELLQLMCANRIHRVYVGKQHGHHWQPQTVITPTDILKVVFTGDW